MQQPLLTVEISHNRESMLEGRVTGPLYLCFQGRSKRTERNRREHWNEQEEREKIRCRYVIAGSDRCGQHFFHSSDGASSEFCNVSENQ